MNNAMSLRKSTLEGLGLTETKLEKTKSVGFFEK